MTRCQENHEREALTQSTGPHPNPEIAAENAKNTKILTTDSHGWTRILQEQTEGTESGIELPRKCAKRKAATPQGGQPRMDTNFH